MVDEIVMDAALRFVPKTDATLMAVWQMMLVAVTVGTLIAAVVAVRAFAVMAAAERDVTRMELALMALVATMFGAVRPVPMLTLVARTEANVPVSAVSSSMAALVPSCANARQYFVPAMSIE